MRKEESISPLLLLQLFFFPRFENLQSVVPLSFFLVPIPVGLVHLYPIFHVQSTNTSRSLEWTFASFQGRPVCSPHLYLNFSVILQTSNSFLPKDIFFLCLLTLRFGSLRHVLHMMMMVVVVISQIE